MTITGMMSQAGTRITNSPAKLTMQVNRKRDHCRGPVTAPATLLEYGDFECFYGGRAYPLVKGMQEYFENNYALYSASFPLCRYTHINNMQQRQLKLPAHRIDSGKLHDLLYKNQDMPDDASLREYAVTSELDMERFDTEMIVQA
jgi:hypothetical protein